MNKMGIYRAVLSITLYVLMGMRWDVVHAQASDASSSWGELFPPQDTWVAKAQDAWRQRDSELLGKMKQEPAQKSHPLAAWVDYWDMNLRLSKLRSSELDAFYERWPRTYVEDRLRNDWLLELGRRREWKAIQKEYPRFQMNDDRQVTCYWYLAQHHAGLDVTQNALSAWLDQPDADDACYLMARTLLQAGQFKESDVWLKVLSSMAASRLNGVKQSLELLPAEVHKVLSAGLDKPSKLLEKKKSLAQFNQSTQSYVLVLLLARYAQQDVLAAGGWLSRQSEDFIPSESQAWLWAQLGRQAGIQVLPQALGYYEKAWQFMEGRESAQWPWTQETLAWAVRVALRLSHPLKNRWILRAIHEMSPREQQEPVWRYWYARALQETARVGDAGEAQRQEAKKIMDSIASPLHFYGKLALENLGQPIRLPAKPKPITPSEKMATQSHPGLERALRLIAMDLRSEGVREWNFSLRGMNDRQLLAAAQWACDRKVWDRCINTSDRTKQEMDLDQRYPTPYRSQVIAQAKDAGLDAAYVFGLIRQESRFVTNAQSHVGAAGLMQVMPATGKWVAKKMGIAFQPSLLHEHDTNLLIGTRYLKWVLDDLGGSQVMAAAAYNAGPGRPRRWREGGTVETAAWAESIPFSETRDYVKKVLSNAVVYSAQLGGETLSLKARMGSVIGPRSSQEQAINASLP